MGQMWESIQEAVRLILSGDTYVLQVIWLSLRVSTTALLISLVLGVPLGMLVGLGRFRGRGLAASLINTGLFMPPVVVGLFFVMIFSRRGVLGDLRLLYSVPAMIIAQVALAAPYVVAITMAAVGSQPKDLRLQALGLGASRIQSLWLIMRESRVALLAAVIAGFGAIISEVGAVMMVGGNIASSRGNETRVMTTAIVQEARMGHFETAMAFGLILLFIAFAINLALTRVQQGAGGRYLRS
jgi:tungstate transport system permease protein